MYIHKCTFLYNVYIDTKDTYMQKKGIIRWDEKSAHKVEGNT